MINAGDEVMNHFRSKNFNLSLKKDGSVVTDVDKKIDKIISQKINKFLPKLNIISEENDLNHNIDPGDTFFLVDPIFK